MRISTILAESFNQSYKLGVPYTEYGVFTVPFMTDKGNKFVISIQRYQPDMVDVIKNTIMGDESVYHDIDRGEEVSFSYVDDNGEYYHHGDEDMPELGEDPMKIFATVIGYINIRMKYNGVDMTIITPASNKLKSVYERMLRRMVPDGYEYHKAGNKDVIIKIEG